METVKKYKLKSGNILSMIRDEDAESPDKWDNEDIFLVHQHRSFTVERKGFEPKDIFHHIETKRRIKKLYSPKNNTDDELELLEEYEEELNSKYDDYYIFPVAAYIHSGVSLSLTDSFERKGWDTSVTGFILVMKEQFAEAEGEHFPVEMQKNKAKKQAEGLIETWNQYLSGDVYGFTINKPIKTYTISEDKTEEIVDLKNGNYQIIGKFIEYLEYEEIDSCWGFYEDDIQTNGILDHINDEIIKEIEL